jgi:methionyl-tRNA formyltransferase
MVAAGTAPKVPQEEEGATYEPSLSKEELQMVSVLSTCF